MKELIIQGEIMPPGCRLLNPHERLDLQQNIPIRDLRFLRHELEEIKYGTALVLQQTPEYLLFLEDLKTAQKGMRLCLDAMMKDLGVRCKYSGSKEGRRHRKKLSIIFAPNLLLSRENKQGRLGARHNELVVVMHFDSRYSLNAIRGVPSLEDCYEPFHHLLTDELFERRMLLNDAYDVATDSSYDADEPWSEFAKQVTDAFLRTRELSTELGYQVF